MGEVVKTRSTDYQGAWVLDSGMGGRGAIANLPHWMMHSFLFSLSSSLPPLSSQIPSQIYSYSWTFKSEGIRLGNLNQEPQGNIWRAENQARGWVPGRMAHAVPQRKPAPLSPSWMPLPRCTFFFMCSRLVTDWCEWDYMVESKSPAWGHAAKEFAEARFLGSAVGKRAHNDGNPPKPRKDIPQCPLSRDAEAPRENTYKEWHTRKGRSPELPLVVFPVYSVPFQFQFLYFLTIMSFSLLRWSRWVLISFYLRSPTNKAQTPVDIGTQAVGLVVPCGSEIRTTRPLIKSGRSLVPSIPPREAASSCAAVFAVDPNRQHLSTQRQLLGS